MQLREGGTRWGEPLPITCELDSKMGKKGGREAADFPLARGRIEEK